MSVTSPKSIVADTSYPTAAQTSGEPGSQTWMKFDFFWAEDALFAWRGVAAFGALLFLTGLVYWSAASGYGVWTMGPFVSLIVLSLFASAFVAFLGFTEVTLALFGTAGIAGALAVWDPPTLLPSAGALWTDSAAVVPDLETVLVLWVVGVAVLVVGVVQSVRTARALDDDI